MKTTAALLVETNAPLVLAELGIPRLQPGQALVEIVYSGACGTQVMEIKGLKGEDRWLPHCLGHEASGWVLEVGEAVTKVKSGDPVALSWIKGHGLEAGGTLYDWEGRSVNAGAVTSFQYHAVVSENRLWPLPSYMPLDIAVLLGCAAPTGMGVIRKVFQTVCEKTVAVFGTGGIGLLAIVAAKEAGAKTLIAIDPKDTRRQLALTLGADHALDPKDPGFLLKIKDLTNNRLDYAVESSGRVEAMALAHKLVRPQGGQAVIIGNAAYGSILKLDPAEFNQGKSLFGTWGGSSQPDEDYPFYADLLIRHEQDLRDLLSKPYQLDEINQALSDLEKGKIGRPLISLTM